MDDEKDLKEKDLPPSGIDESFIKNFTSKFSEFMFSNFEKRIKNNEEKIKRVEASSRDNKEDIINKLNELNSVLRETLDKNKKISELQGKTIELNIRQQELEEDINTLLI